MSMKMTEIFRGDHGEEVNDASMSEQVRVCFDSSPDVWFRKRITEDENGNVCAASAETEIITMNPDVESALRDLEEKNPEAVRILSDIEDGGFHAILGPEVVTVLMAPMGPMEFLLGEPDEEGSVLSAEVD